MNFECCGLETEGFDNGVEKYGKYAIGYTMVYNYSFHWP